MTIKQNIEKKGYNTYKDQLRVKSLVSNNDILNISFNDNKEDQTKIDAQYKIHEANKMSFCLYTIILHMN